MAWIKVFHIVGMVVWLGALLDLTRLLGYHVKEEIEVQKRMSWMEFRLFFFVATPGLAVTWILGLSAFFTGGGVAGYLQGAGWFHAKLTLVVLLTAIHAFMGKQILALRANPGKQNPAKFKALHGITALSMILVIILVVVRPF